MQTEKIMYIYKTLTNGIRVVAEKIDYLKSVSIGVWVGNGSRHERPEENGISHFIEHMVFKGTLHRSAAEIAGALDAVGGQINAFTAREYTCFYTKTLDAHASIAMDILSDMIFCPSFNEDDMALERNVIEEEISLYEDSPEELVYDLYYRAVWGDSSMGRTILGTGKTLESIDSKKLREYMQSHYTSENMIISVSGNFDDGFFDELEKYFGSRTLHNGKPYMPKAEFGGNVIVKNKDIEQVQLVVGFKGIDVMDDASAYPLLVFNNVFGYGMSSRLFQNIREKEGLVYSVGAGHSAYIGTGSFDIAAGMNPANLERVCSLIEKEIKTIKRDKLTKDEVERSKEMLKGNYILSYESTGARMQGAGRSLLLDKPVYSQDEALKKIEAVNVDSVAEIIDRVLDTSIFSAAVVGPVDINKDLFNFISH